MNKKIILVGIILGAFSIVAIFEYLIYINTNGPVEKLGTLDTFALNDGPVIKEIKGNILYNTLRITDIGVRNVTIPIDRLLFHYDVTVNEQGRILQPTKITPNENYTSLYHEIGNYNTTKKTVFVYPIFTQAAYSNHGFYDYYNGICDSSCLTIKIPSQIIGVYQSSVRSALVLTILNYSYITDADIDQNPDILKRYDRIIILHSEYVTKREFDAITNHSNVVYLYPNALYAEIKSDYLHDTITLVRGHGYPDSTIKNGFDWKFDNSKYEYDNQCDNWTFYPIDNGKMLNCYPSFRMYYDQDLLKAIKD